MKLLLLFLVALNLGNYNPESVVTISGAISTIEELSTVEDASPILKMNIVTNDGTIEVYLGPVSYLSHPQLPFRPDDRVEVTGSIVEIGGKTVLLASTIKKGRYFMRLRDHQGKPIWDGSSS